MASFESNGNLPSIYPTLSQPEAIVAQVPIDRAEKPRTSVLQFEKFRSPDRHNLQLHKHFVRRNFPVCKLLIEEILAESPEVLCEYQLILRAQISREEGDIRNSIEWLSRALAHNPRSTRILFELGKSHYLLGDHRKAIEMFSRGLEERQKQSKEVANDWKLYYWLSLAYYHIYSPPECVQKAQETLLSFSRINSSTDMLMFLARLLGEQNDIGAAIEAYKRSIQMEPENVDLVHNLGMLYLKASDQPNAFATFGKALSYDPNYVPSILAIASVLQSNSDFDVALSKYKVAANEFDHSCALWNNIGMCFFGKGKLIAALICLNRANYLCPLDWKVLFNLSLVYYALRQYASAYHFISSAYAVYQQNPLILCVMAVILTELKDFRNAKAAYKRALKLNPSLWVARINFAIFEFRRGNVAEAIKRMGNLEGMDGLANFEELFQMAHRLRNACLTVAERKREAIEQGPSKAE